MSEWDADKKEWKVKKDIVNWNVVEVGEMFMFNHIINEGKSAAACYETYNEKEYLLTAAHEFGHILGINDAYGKDARAEANVTDEVPDIYKGKLYDGDMMRDHGEVSSNYIEMMFLAAKLNKWQSFQEFGGYSISEVIQYEKI